MLQWRVAAIEFDEIVDALSPVRPYDRLEREKDVARDLAEHRGYGEVCVRIGKVWIGGEVRIRGVVRILGRVRNRGAVGARVFGLGVLVGAWAPGLLHVPHDGLVGGDLGESNLLLGVGLGERDLLLGVGERGGLCSIGGFLFGVGAGGLDLGVGGFFRGLGESRFLFGIGAGCLDFGVGGFLGSLGECGFLFGVGLGECCFLLGVGLGQGGGILLSLLVHGVPEFEFFLEDSSLLFRTRHCFVSLDQVVFCFDLCCEDLVLCGTAVPHVGGDLSVFWINGVHCVVVPA